MAKQKIGSGAKTYKKLVEDGHVTFSREAFDAGVKRGVIPYELEEKDGVRARKKFIYEDVVKALKESGIGKPAIKPPTEIENLPLPEEGESPEQYAGRLSANPSLTEVNIYHNLYKGKLQELKYLEESGRLIEREEVEDTAFQVARVIRDKMMTIPERLSAELASMDNPHEIKEFLYKEIGLVLETLKEGKAFIDEQPDN